MKNKKEIKKLQLMIEQIVSNEMKLVKEESGFYKQDLLYRAFIEPFADIVDTVKAETSKLTATAFQNVKKLAKQSAILAIPFMSISGIAKAEEEAKTALDKRIGEIDKEYQDVYRRTWDTMRGRDVLGLGFLLGPHYAIGKTLGANWALGFKLAKDAPVKLLSALEVLSGGNPKVTAAKKAYEKKIKAVVHGAEGYTAGGGRWGGGFGGLGGGMGFGGGDGGMGESIEYFFEQASTQQASIKQQPPTRGQAPAQQRPPGTTQNNKNLSKEQQLEAIYKSLATTVQKLVTDPSVQKSMSTSPMTKQFQAAGVEAISKTMKPILSANSYEQLKSAVGPQFSKMESELMKSIPEDEATPEQIEQYKANFVEEYKQQYKNLFASQIQKSAGMDPNTQKLVGDIVKQIKS